MANDIGQKEKQRDSIKQWAEKMESSVSEHMNKPPKFRKDALESEIRKIESYSEAVMEKQHSLVEFAPDDSELQNTLETLSSKINILKDLRIEQSIAIENFRQLHEDTQNWVESLSKSFTTVDECQEENTEEKKAKITDLINAIAEKDEKINDLTSKGDIIKEHLDKIDQELVSEQIQSLERKMADIQKRIGRRGQILEMALSGFNNTRAEVLETLTWLHAKKDALTELQQNESSAEAINTCRELVKEIENKMILIKSLETKIEMISTEIDSNQLKELNDNLKQVEDQQAQLEKSAKNILVSLQETSGMMDKLDESLSEVQNWIKIKSSEYQKSFEHVPLKSVDIDKKLALMKKEQTEIGNTEETKFSQLRLGVVSLQKSSQNTDTEQQFKELEQSLTLLKETLRTKFEEFENQLKDRKQFETEIDTCNSWINQSEIILTTEVRGTINLAMLDDHHNKFKRLKDAEEENRKLVGDVFETASNFMDQLSDSDRISLQTMLDEMCDKQNYVADSINAKISNLVRNIEVYKKTAQKIEDSVNHLTEIQTQIRLLNKPIGYRVEDAEDVLEAYEKILENLKAFKIQMEDLQKTAGSNVTEVRALMGQQDELIRAIENQMSKIRSLISHRHQFMTMVTGITSFIIKHTEVVKQVERSSIPPMEKVKKYDESISKLKDCETQLALASDKGHTIASEGSAADRNQISHQLQSLKTQILALQRAIEKKRDEHIKSVQDHNKVFSELESFLEWIQSKEMQVRERPYLSTTVDNVDNHIAEHNELSTTIMEKVENIKSFISETKKDSDISSSTYNLLSSVTALVQVLPRELEERRQYLENNKNYRYQYDSLTARLNNWIEEAQLKLRPLDSGVDFQNLETDLAEHQKYFSQETKLKELLHSIHEMANKIWASLATKDQDKINHEQEFFTQLVKNTLNSANSKQAELEKKLKLWKEYSQFVQRMETMFEDLKFDEETPSSLSSLKNSISKVDSQIQKIQSKKSTMEQFLNETKMLEDLADTINKFKISEKSQEFQTKYNNIQLELQNQRETLSNLLLQWEDYDEKYRRFESQMSGLHQRFSSQDMSMSSVKQLTEVKETSKTLLSDLQTLQGHHNDIQIISSQLLR